MSRYARYNRGMVLALATLLAQVNWLDDYDAALKQAREQKKLLVVHFWADW